MAGTGFDTYSDIRRQEMLVKGTLQQLHLDGKGLRYLTRTLEEKELLLNDSQRRALRLQVILPHNQNDSLYRQVLKRYVSNPRLMVFLGDVFTIAEDDSNERVTRKVALYTYERKNKKNSKNN